MFEGKVRFTDGEELVVWVEEEEREIIEIGDGGVGLMLDKAKAPAYVRMRFDVQSRVYPKPQGGMAERRRIVFECGGEVGNPEEKEKDDEWEMEEEEEEEVPKRTVEAGTREEWEKEEGEAIEEKGQSEEPARQEVSQTAESPGIDQENNS